MSREIATTISLKWTVPLLVVMISMLAWIHYNGLLLAKATSPIDIGQPCSVTTTLVDSNNLPVRLAGYYQSVDSQKVCLVGP